MIRRLALACAAATLICVALGCTKQPLTSDSRIDNLPIPTSVDLLKVAALPNPYNKGNATKGRAAFGECAECHSLAANGLQEKGPALNQIFGRPAASGKNFAYSEALRNSTIVWDAQHLDQWIFNPHETLPGTSMTYIGVRNDAKRHDILAYLIAVSN